MNLCTHPDTWPCSESKINPGRCGTQETHDVAMGCIDGHYSLNPRGSANVGEIESAHGEVFKTGWTGNSEPAVGEMTEDEVVQWDELNESGHYVMPRDDTDGA